jgi:hypothetical protein
MATTKARERFRFTEITQPKQLSVVDSGDPQGVCPMRAQERPLEDAETTTGHVSEAGGNERRVH